MHQECMISSQWNYCSLSNIVLGEEPCWTLTWPGNDLCVFYLPEEEEEESPEMEMNNSSAAVLSETEEDDGSLSKKDVSVVLIPLIPSCCLWLKLNCVSLIPRVLSPPSQKVSEDNVQGEEPWIFSSNVF